MFAKRYVSRICVVGKAARQISASRPFRRGELTCVDVSDADTWTRASATPISVRVMSPVPVRPKSTAVIIVIDP